VTNDLNNQLPCLPPPEWYLRRKRQTIKDRHDEMVKYINDLKWKLSTAFGITSDLRYKYQAIDYRLAEIDGRLKREAQVTAQEAKQKTVKDKVTSIGYTTEQIAAIAAVLNISLEE